MGFIPVANCVELELRGIWADQRVENTLYVNLNEPSSAANVFAACALASAWFQASYLPNTGAQFTFTEVFGTGLDTASSPAVSYTVDLPDPGPAGVPCASNALSPCITFKTEQRGRSHTGRNYLMGTPGSAVAQNTLQAPYMAAMVSAYQDFASACIAEGFRWVVVSRFSGMGGSPRRPIPRAAGIMTPINTVLFTDAIVDVQRRRLPGRGM